MEARGLNNGPAIFVKPISLVRFTCSWESERMVARGHRLSPRLTTTNVHSMLWPCSPPASLPEDESAERTFHGLQRPFTTAVKQIRGLTGSMDERCIVSLRHWAWFRICPSATMRLAAQGAADTAECFVHSSGWQPVQNHDLPADHQWCVDVACCQCLVPRL